MYMQNRLDSSKSMTHFEFYRSSKFEPTIAYFALYLPLKNNLS